MPHGGTLTIETSNLSLDDGAARQLGLPPGDYINISVTDTGSGMQPEVAARAFDPFFTTKPLGSGTGLGLSMVYGFARQSDGSVTIATEPDVGTSIRMYLPRMAANDLIDVVAEKTSETRDVKPGETILLVDDEPLVRMFIAEVLKDLGYQVLEAEDASSAVKILHSKARIDLLITDVGLPGALNGRQLADLVRQTKTGLRVLFITGYAEAEVFRQAKLEAGMMVIGKPFSNEELANKIAEILRVA